MIKIRIKNADHEIDVQFPISENALYAKLAEIHAIEGKDAPQSAFVTEVYWPEEFSIYLADRANKDGECWPAIPTIARDLRLSQSTVRRALHDLRIAGLITSKQRYRDNGGKSSLLYVLKR